MGDYNSSLTRVQPVFNALLAEDPSGVSWLQGLCDLASATRPEAARLDAAGPLLPEETPAEENRREGKLFERIVPPPTAFLRWLIDHPELMDVRDRDGFGAKGEEVRSWRAKLFSSSPPEREEAQHEARARLAAVGNRGSARKRWAFEGFSHIDCCLITEKLVLFVEGKWTESISPATLWFKQRSQLWRNVEAAKEFAAGKEFAVILAVESEDDGRRGLSDAQATLASSYPHLPDQEQQDLSRHVLGYVTWMRLVCEFGLPESCLVERVIGGE